VGCGDEVTSQPEIMILQYAYSEAFEQSVDIYTSHLLKKFAVIFEPSIKSTSLRQAMLAFTAAGMHNTALRERAEYHSDRASRELRRKTSATLDEGDLFAACLLTCVSRYHHDLNSFCIHLGGFTVIMEELAKKAKVNGERNTLSILWPLGRDLILWSSTEVPKASEHVLDFCIKSHTTLGNQSFWCRSEYTKEVLGTGTKTDNLAFGKSLSIYYVLLRRCFRLAICHEMDDADTKNHRTVRSIASEVKLDLTTFESKEILARLRAVIFFKASHQYDEWENAVDILLLYYACGMLIALLEVDEMLLGPFTQIAIYETTSFLEFLRNLDQLSDQCEFVFTESRSMTLLPRMLCIAGLSLNRIKHPECMPPMLQCILTTICRVNMGYQPASKTGGITSGRSLGAFLGIT
jgi:hypothetical protein